ncbi:GLPGLI family protein [Olivibacter sitiensis]|uniref:GLPGLI family protein n=1 Tax=Olivibacter sitiensis TaxID=376470 RepID=UPI00042931CE|nr:GLPGLI family protein [Olivibacter sitiensis]
MRLFSIIPLFLFLLAFGEPLHSFSQSKDRVIAVAEYRYEHVMDTSRPSDRYMEHMVLTLSKESSVFFSGALAEAQGNFKARPVLTEQNGATTVKANVKRYYFPQELYVDHVKGTLFVVEKIVNPFLYEDAYPKINWDISSDSQVIQGVACQKAVGGFGGRTWTVWFSSEIPFSAGPWKLVGLPGLIVKATDERNSINFALISFQRVDEGEGQVAIPETRLTTAIPDDARIIKTDKKHVARLWDAYSKNKDEFVRSQIRAANGVISDLISLESLASKPYCNNPIELR